MTTSTDIYDTIKANRLERMKTNNKIKGELSNNTLKKYTSSINSISFFAPSKCIYEPLTTIWTLMESWMVLIFLSSIPKNESESTPDISIFFFRNAPILQPV